MAHYAFLDANNIVTEVIVGKDEGEDNIDWEQWYGSFKGQVCKRTSYNTIGGIHLAGGRPFRKNYAGIGYRYDPVLDAFIPPNEIRGFVLNVNTCQWEPPFPMPNDGKQYVWDQDLENWTEYNYDPNSVVPPQ